MYDGKNDPWKSFIVAWFNSIELPQGRPKSLSSDMFPKRIFVMLVICSIAHDELLDIGYVSIAKYCLKVIWWLITSESYYHTVIQTVKNSLTHLPYLSNITHIFDSLQQFTDENLNTIWSCHSGERRGVLAWRLPLSSFPSLQKAPEIKKLVDRLTFQI